MVWPVHYTATSGVVHTGVRRDGQSAAGCGAVQVMATLQAAKAHAEAEASKANKQLAKVDQASAARLRIVFAI